MELIVCSAFKVEMVKDTMDERGEKHPCGDQEDHPGIKGVEGSEELARNRGEGVDRSHAAHDHGGVEEGIDQVMRPRESGNPRFRSAAIPGSSRWRSGRT